MKGKHEKMSKLDELKEQFAGVIEGLNSLQLNSSVAPLE